MSFNDERAAIEGRFASGYSNTPIQFEDIPFAQPSTAWVALTILSGAGINTSIGGTRQVQRFAGIIQIDVYIPEDTGTKPARDIADLVDPIFNNAQFSFGSSGTITTFVPSYQTLGVENGWYHAVVSVAYQRTKIA